MLSTGGPDFEFQQAIEKYGEERSPKLNGLGQISLFTGNLLGKTEFSVDFGAFELKKDLEFQRLRREFPVKWNREFIRLCWEFETAIRDFTVGTPFPKVAYPRTGGFRIVS